MLGVIRTRDILAHPVVTIRCFGWLLFFRALLARKDRTFLSLVCELPPPPPRVAVPELIERTIGLEERTQKIYEHLAERFRLEPKLQAFFARMAREEHCHAELLRLCRAAAERSGWKEAAFAPWRRAIPEVEQLLDHAEAELDGLDTLEEVLEVVRRIEGSEINDVFHSVVAATDSDFVRSIESFEAACSMHLDHLQEEIARLQTSTEVV